ncbi:MAG: paraquat-inducible protein A, partial [Vicinamibacterales bacterium]|nr:paraquat-inducible protein A [Vicinamibacterales bacterium]
MTRLHVVLTLLNFVLLVPGVTLPIYSVTITTQVEASIIPEPIEVTVYEQTRSILGTVRELWRSDDHLVSFLILLFSIIVPVTKGSMLLASIYVTKQAVKRWLVRLVDLIGKWSMADVFVVAVFLAFLATRDQAQANTFSVPVLLQQVEVGMQTHLTSTLGP